MSRISLGSSCGKKEKGAISSALPRNSKLLFNNKSICYCKQKVKFYVKAKAWHSVTDLGYEQYGFLQRRQLGIFCQMSARYYGEGVATISYGA